MSFRAILVSVILASPLLATTAAADMGSVHVETQGVEVHESAQKAIILHNDREEVLILGTEIGATRQTPIIRFIPFPSEPKVSLAPKGVFERLAEIVGKYRLQYAYAHYTKGGGGGMQRQGVEVRLSARLGEHDLTVIRVHDVAAFRSWVNDYFRRKGLRSSNSYPQAEAVVADYVARGIDFFVLDAVDVGKDPRLVDPLVYRFKSRSLYYPLKTSNTFGGRGEIELFIIAPTTLCVPGSTNFANPYDAAVDAKGRAAGPCLNLPVKASTSVLLVPEEHDLKALYADGEAFFGGTPVFLQAIRYVGNYQFKNDIVVPMPQGVAKALDAPHSVNRLQEMLAPLAPPDRPACRETPERGPCKGHYTAYYFDRQSSTCKSFVWGGCQGVVPFQTREQCMGTCTWPPSSSPSGG